MKAPLLERYDNDILGVLSCYDRIVITGTLPGICYAEGMTSILYNRGIKIFDFPNYAKKYRDLLDLNTKKLAEDNALTVQHISNHKSFRKEDRIAEIIEARGNHPGLVHIFSAMETCDTYEPRYDDRKTKRKVYLKHRRGMCKHYYFYFIDEALGLCYLRLPTYIPFRLQFYCNGHNLLAAKMRRKGISFTQADNTFVKIGNFKCAQELADSLCVEDLHRRLDEFALQYCPVSISFGEYFHWSVMQIEYATDIVFKSEEALSRIYEDLAMTAMFTVKPADISGFLGHEWKGPAPDDIGSRLKVRHYGICIKHYSGRNSVKMYPKFGRVLRIETTSSDISYFKHYRKVEHRDGTSETKYASMKKSIYSISALRELMLASNTRYLLYLSDLEDPTAGKKALDKLTESVKCGQHNYRGFNLFQSLDLKLLSALMHGGFNISGLRNKDMRRLIPEMNPSQMSRAIKRLHTHGIIKKIGKTYKYYLTDMGKKVIAMLLELRHFVVIPSLAG